MKRKRWGYRPIDELYSKPRIRVLRALRFFDWVSTEDLSLACEVGDSPTARNTFSAAVSRVVELGHARRRSVEFNTARSSRTFFVYQITSKGRRELKLMARDYERALEEAA